VGGVATVMLRRRDPPAAESKSDAKTKLAQLEVEILEKGTARLEAGKVTFRQLPQYVKNRFYVPATYSEDGSKVLRPY
jgi:hypothetical protein